MVFETKKKGSFFEKRFSEGKLTCPNPSQSPVGTKEFSNLFQSPYGTKEFSSGKPTGQVRKFTCPFFF
jgi:hypothetical protein